MLAERLRELRLSSKLTQNDLAQLLHITREAYTMYETGKRQLSYDSLCKIADYYQVSTDYLLNRTSIKNGPQYLNTGEAELLSHYRLADNRGKESIRALAEIESSRNQKKKTEK